MVDISFRWTRLNGCKIEMDAQALDVNIERDVADVAAPAQQPRGISVHLQFRWTGHD